MYGVYRRSKLFATVAILCPTVVLADSLPPNHSNCEHQIIFLPQTHRNVISPQLSQNDSTDVAQSQFAIASFISAHLGVPIFSEQVDEDMDASQITGDLKIASEQINSLFPRGIPKKYEDLSDEQKRQLVQAGADGVLFLTGKTPALHKIVTDRETQDILFSRITKLMSDLRADSISGPDVELFKLLNDNREKMALTEVRNFFSANPHIKSVFLIFGRNHNFRRHGDIFPENCIDIPSEFNTPVER